MDVATWLKGLGLEAYAKSFEENGVFHRTVMYVNQASDPIVERLLVPDMALAVAERFAVEENKRVLVLLTDMTSYADAMKEIAPGIRVEAKKGRAVLTGPGVDTAFLEALRGFAVSHAKGSGVTR